MTASNNKLYFPVKNVRFQDLYDWANKDEQCKTSSSSVRIYTRQNSKSGTMTEINEVKIALFRFRDKVYSINEKCPHAGGPLHVGDIEVLPNHSLCVRCPWHSWRFDLETGKVRHPPGRDLNAEVYPVKIDDDGKLSVGFEQFSSKYFNGEEDF